MRSKRSIIIGILLLAIGFATVSTTLFLNGTFGIGVNEDDYDIIFTSAKIGENAQSIKTTNKTADTIEFDVLLNKVGEEKVLEYTIKNNSTQYEANARMKCYAVNDTDEFMSKYITISGELAGKNVSFTQLEANAVLSEEINFKAQQSKNGTITMALKKSYAGTSELSVSLKCEIITNAGESGDLEEIEVGNYNVSATLVNSSNEPQANLQLVVYSNTPHFVTTDVSGRFTVNGLEKGLHELYYVASGYENKTKAQIVQTANIKINFTTDGYVTDDISGYKLSNIEINAVTVTSLPEGWTAPMYFEYGDPTTSSTTNWTTMEKNVFVAIDDAGNKGVCITPTINGRKKIECFKYGTSNTSTEIAHLTNVARNISGDSSKTCTIDNDCNFGQFSCDVAQDGYIRCYDSTADCSVNAFANVYCG